MLLFMLAMICIACCFLVMVGGARWVLEDGARRPQSYLYMPYYNKLTLVEQGHGVLFSRLKGLELKSFG